jgi:peptidoglycan/xylan/chitin deacetylase (PgdA/CDA1 family)
VVSFGHPHILTRHGAGPAGRRAIDLSDVLVLCYHAVSEDWPAELSVTPGRLREQLEWLVRRGYRGVTFAEAVLEPARGRTVAVTFDDAFRSVRERAAPILAELGLPGTVFVPTGFPGRSAPMAWPGIDQWLGGPHEAELRPLSWPELGELAEAGWEVGSHTRTHPRLTTLDAARLEDELAGSRAECERQLGRPCRTLAYPYGDHDERVAEAAGRAGYSAAGTLPSRLRAGGPLRWPRVGVYHRDDARRFRAKASPAVRRLRGSVLWTALARSGGALGRS